MKRRSFLKVVGGVTGSMAMGIAPVLVSEAEAAAGAARGAMPKRELGRTGLKVSVVPFAGLALTHYEQEECTAGVHRAFDKGLNYYDVAPAYGKDGDCEIKLGVALQGLKRSDYVLTCKTKARDQSGCRQELERSLARLKTDHFDLYQLHHLVKPEDVKQALGPPQPQTRRSSKKWPRAPVPSSNEKRTRLHSTHRIRTAPPTVAKGSGLNRIFNQAPGQDAGELRVVLPGVAHAEAAKRTSAILRLNSVCRLSTTHRG